MSILTNQIKDVTNRLMKTIWNSTDHLKRCRIIATAILLAGLGCAAAVYLSVGETPVDPFAEFENSKKFAYELERMGGKAALFANDFNRWFAGLWHGQNLAFTIAVLTIITAAAYYFVASGLAADAETD